VGGGGVVACLVGGEPRRRRYLGRRGGAQRVRCVGGGKEGAGGDGEYHRGRDQVEQGREGSIRIGAPERRGRLARQVAWVRANPVTRSEPHSCGMLRAGLEVGPQARRDSRPCGELVHGAGVSGFGGGGVVGGVGWSR